MTNTLSPPRVWVQIVSKVTSPRGWIVLYLSTAGHHRGSKILQLSERAAEAVICPCYGSVVPPSVLDGAIGRDHASGAAVCGVVDVAPLPVACHEGHIFGRECVQRRPHRVIPLARQRPWRVELRAMETSRHAESYVWSVHTNRDPPRLTCQIWDNQNRRSANRGRVARRMAECVVKANLPASGSIPADVGLRFDSS